MTKNTPSKGNIIVLDFSPQVGHEQAGNRPGFVVSPMEFNDVTGFAWVCPITSKKKGYPFEVDIDGAEKTTGVILVDQMKSIDWRARNIRIVDTTSQKTQDEVTTLIDTIIN